MTNGSEFHAQSRVKRRSAWFGPLALVLIFVVAALFMSLVYRVRSIHVVNASEYTDAQIIQASGLQTGTNLFFVDRFEAASLIFSNLPYMEEVSIQRKLPGTIVIQAKGTAASAWMQVGGECWLVDRVGTMLGTAALTDARKYTEIRGINASTPMEGETMIVDENNAPRLAAATELISALLAEDMLGKVDYIDVSDSTGPVFHYDGRLTVYPGDMAADGAYRMAMCRDALGKLSSGDTGILTYGGETRWVYSPD